MAKQSPKRIIPISLATDTQAMHAGVQPSQKVYPRYIQGYFKRWRWAMIWLTQIVFYGMPWLQLGERQAVLFDIAHQRFYLAQWVIYPQDLYYLALLLMLCAFALFLFTAVAGRVWCGFACPQSVYTEIFLTIEHWFEGDRLARQALDQAGTSVKKWRIKLGKHSVWLVFSLITGITFVGYFTPIRELLPSLSQGALSEWELFWLGFYSLATYGNAGFLREQVCKHMCPYARFQSAMFDQHTLIVAYDTGRGEPRGGRSKESDYQTQGLGACIDCNICVQVCPTGIDIRNGLQYECISCGLCIDACDQVMDKMHYPRGLIKFATADGKATKATLQHVLRPRVLLYLAALVIISAVFVYSLAHKPPFRVDVMRDRQTLYRETSQGIENAYQVRLTNVSEHTETYVLAVSGQPDLTISAEQPIQVAPADEALIAISIATTATQQHGSLPIQLRVTARATGETVISNTKLIVP